MNDDDEWYSKQLGKPFASSQQLLTWEHWMSVATWLRFSSFRTNCIFQSLQNSPPLQNKVNNSLLSLMGELYICMYRWVPTHPGAAHVYYLFFDFLLLKDKEKGDISILGSWREPGKVFVLVKVKRVWDKDYQWVDVTTIISYITSVVLSLESWVFFISTPFSYLIPKFKTPNCNINSKI